MRNVIFLSRVYKGVIFLTQTKFLKCDEKHTKTTRCKLLFTHFFVISALPLQVLCNKKGVIKITPFFKIQQDFPNPRKKPASFPAGLQRRKVKKILIFYATNSGYNFGFIDITLEIITTLMILLNYIFKIRIED